jgi:hypothetical protein
MPFDILLDADFDLAIAGGDLAMGESTKQHQQLLLKTAPGEWREYPTVGIDIQKYLLSEASEAELASAIKAGFENDGMTTAIERGVLRASYDKLEIEADGYYNS